MNLYSFDYPEKCTICKSFSKTNINLQVAPYYRPGNDFRLMLIGQDPTIFQKPERVKHVLMLDEPNGQLTRWLRTLFGDENFSAITIYATNIVKCTFEFPPSQARGGGHKFLQPYFENCKEYLRTEIVNYQPTLAIALGEPAHKLFASFLDIEDFPNTMQEAFTGEFIKCEIGGHTFDYSPCLHIKTWRVAEVYGKSVIEFKQGIASYFNKR